MTIFGWKALGWFLLILVGSIVLTNISIMIAPLPQ